MPNPADGAREIDLSAAYQSARQSGQRVTADDITAKALQIGQESQGLPAAENNGEETPEQTTTTQDPKVLEKELSDSGRVISRIGEENKKHKALADAALAALSDLDNKRLKLVLEEDERIASAFQEKFPDRHKTILGGDEIEEKPSAPVDLEKLTESLTEKVIINVYKKQQEHELLDSAKKFAESRSIKEDDFDSFHAMAKAVKEANPRLTYEQALKGAYATISDDSKQSAPLVPHTVAPEQSDSPDIELRVAKLMRERGLSKEKATRIVQAAQASLQGMTLENGRMEVSLNS